MAGSENRKRNQPVSVRFSDEEKAELKARADRAGVTPASYLRCRGLDQPFTRATRRPPAVQTEVARLIGHIGQLSDSIEELKAAGHDAAMLDAIASDMADIRVAAFQALGRKP